MGTLDNERYCESSQREKGSICHRKPGTHEASVEYKESRKKLKQGVRRAKRGHKKSLAAGLRKIPRLFIHI